MVQITVDLIRRRAEHNNMELSTLEEVSLHQQDIEKIELLDKVCRELKIIYLQSNLIPKIENVKRLKKLEYLNLALNNIERIENLEGCESLKKLDLTVNFVGELTSIECLKQNYNLEELFLTGNPCVDFDGYQEYVIATLPQLKRLDGAVVEKSARIKAVQDLPRVRANIIQQQKEYHIRREREKKEEEEKEASKLNKKPGFDGRWYTDVNSHSGVQDMKEEEDGLDDDKDDEENSKFWEEKVGFTPESRKAVHEHVRKQREKEDIKRNGPEPKKRVVRLVGDDGRILNVNEAKLDFTLTDSEDGSSLLLDVACFKHLDTSLMDTDVQPNYVKVIVKGKVLQLVLSEEVKPDSSSAKRSQTTGHLLIEMPKLHPRKPGRLLPCEYGNKNNDGEKNKRNEIERLEVDPSAAKTIDLLVTQTKCLSTNKPYNGKRQKPAIERPNSHDFIDDPDVPPLI
ncbi:protein tilB homolog [Anneissia japonica]|uniref:protein tilB homolog n=1 Tax=Anneissia japonica TaxID=1529436 RepID=UPI0014256850|nr:protein tilB homolog [Anneissia japonica]XP_033113677.1 protein tilB homolog [Anneissia japonica]